MRLLSYTKNMKNKHLNNLRITTTLAMKDKEKWSVVGSCIFMFCAPIFLSMEILQFYCLTEDFSAEV